jgi:hypothetical protein
VRLRSKITSELPNNIRFCPDFQDQSQLSTDVSKNDFALKNHHGTFFNELQLMIPRPSSENHTFQDRRSRCRKSVQTFPEQATSRQPLPNCKIHPTHCNVFPKLSNSAFQKDRRKNLAHWKCLESKNQT